MGLSNPLDTYGWHPWTPHVLLSNPNSWCILTVYWLATPQLLTTRTTPLALMLSDVSSWSTTCWSYYDCVLANLIGHFDLLALILGKESSGFAYQELWFLWMAVLFSKIYHFRRFSSDFNSGDSHGCAMILHTAHNFVYTCETCWRFWKMSRCIVTPTLTWILLK